MKRIVMITFCMLMLCTVVACGQKTVNQSTKKQNSSDKVVLTQKDEDLQKRIDTLKERDAFIPHIYYLSDEKMVIADTAGLVNYDLKQGKITDVLLGEENGFTGAFYIQGDDSDMIFADSKGEKIYFLPDMETKKVAPYYYDLTTKELVEITKGEAKKIKGDAEMQNNNKTALAGEWKMGDAKYSFKQTRDEGEKCAEWGLKCTKGGKIKAVELWH